MFKKINAVIIVTIIAVLSLCGCEKIERVWSEPLQYNEETAFYNESFATEITEGAKELEQFSYELNADNEEFIDAWNEGHLRIGPDYIQYFNLADGKSFVIKAYIIDMALNPEYFEIYLYNEGEYKLLKSLNASDFCMTISDGTYLYYSYDGILYRLTESGNEKLMLDAKYNAPDANKYYEKQQLPWDFVTSSISGEGDEIIINADYSYRTKDEEWAFVEKIIRLNADSLKATVENIEH
ncbi:MAG: hypothetical protein IJZ65_01755 [Ruminiclostridium sp.]|nr:hypothetical protein [Ruminiclostridium sp.]